MAPLDLRFTQVGLHFYLCSSVSPHCLVLSSFCRQDQLILQIITLFDRILQQENLDLKLTPFHVVATSSKVIGHV